MSKPWFRLYHELLDDPKVLRLPDPLFSIWIRLLCVACRCDGIIPPVADAALIARVPAKRIENSISDLLSRELLDRHGDGYVPHGWASRQFESDTSKDRQRRYRERHAKRNGDVTVTAQDTEQIQSRAEHTHTRTKNGADGQRELSREIARTNEEVESLAWCEAVYDNHPTPGRRDESLLALRERFWTCSDAAANRKLWEANYPKWLASERWQERGRKFVPLLVNVVIDGTWKKPPVDESSIDPWADVDEWKKQQEKRT